MDTTAVQTRFRGIDIATANMDEMVKFYREVFQVEFDEIVHGDWRLYRGELAGMNFLLAPSEPSGTDESTPGVHQFHLAVEDLPEFVERVRSLGYRVESANFGPEENYCVRDADGHPWIVGQNSDGI
ncbi:MAG: VOC family protein [Ignavibacteriae bacterium]|nr:VOC family protein [Ignavibacteriota bacterium]MCB9215584.1 VOC family protein [Ignavibacteria bacterium]